MRLRELHERRILHYAGAIRNLFNEYTLRRQIPRLLWLQQFVLPLEPAIRPHPLHIT